MHDASCLTYRLLQGPEPEEVRLDVVLPVKADGILLAQAAAPVLHLEVDFGISCCIFERFDRS